MLKQKLVRITTVPMSLEKLLEGQLSFMSHYYNVIAVSSDKERLQMYGVKEGVATYHTPFTRKITPIKDIYAVYRLVRFFKSEKPLIVHTHTPKAGIVGMIAAYLAGVPIRLHTVAGLPLMEAKGSKRKVLNFVERLTYRLATKIYPNSKGLYEFILRERFITKKKLKIIGNGSSNGIDTKYFNPGLFSSEAKSATRKNIGIPLHDFVFVFVGRIVKDKGINELIDAFLLLQKTNKNTTLLLVGPFEEDLDPILPSTLEIISSHPKIFSIGYKEDVRPYFACSNALAFPSYREGFPNVVMQAGAMQLPVIATNINGCNEIVIDGTNGLLIPVKDTGALHIAMQKLVNDTALYARLRSNSSDLIASKYERIEICKALLEEYQALEAKL